VEQIQQFCTRHNLFAPHEKIIIGLSGGPDSVFLVHYLHEIKEQYQLELIAAHLDHGWRSNSADDAQWCKKLCEKLNIHFISAHANNIVLQKQANGSKEEHGRLLRRAFFESCLQKFNAHKIALGHHYDDNVETFFLRFLRGSSTAGLQGIKPNESPYIRPLLALTKQEILNYLHQNNIEYLIDHTNESDAFLRNRIRKNIIPALQVTDDRWHTAAQRTFENLHETETFLTQFTQKTFQEISTVQDSKLSIDKEKFLAQEPFLQKRILLHWLCTEKVPFVPSQQFFDEILRFIKTSKKISHRLSSEWALQQKKKILSLIFFIKTT
jgi:tRNA(Ile)-lysidine synthase